MEIPLDDNPEMQQAIDEARESSLNNQ